MAKIKVLDCTLRDGGYCNEWRFGADNIRTIIEGLTESGVELIECGFLSNPQEDVLLNSADYQQKLTDGILNGIIACFT